ncbi:putative MFS family arabinose efflux permease [Methylobacter tundripaludum]|uniref:Putative MFS family arabinose efflux permease n=1 Tax=Methylobacter tundripaludum TaxID=173365 RepID=A0A2S6HER8_9GAMM|nr:MFS transporter [Methylobacter tundripaludum]PPK75989.1 putative MFS family arabinose efflux permease [Methylobacter tundripaludum]
MTAAERRMVMVVMFCHFIAAFAALGMPPFFALILSKSLHNSNAYLVGWFYVVPTFFTALSSPWWGAFADRIGKKVSLLRAQLGLSASFLLAGYSNDTGLFFLALALQGMLGGTFAASNAYLATMSSGPALARSLTLMQGSARAALVVAPAVLGLFAASVSPIELYRYLALLPLAAALLLWLLPEPAQTAHDDYRPENTVASQPLLPANNVYLLQFAFVFATVATFPYFIPYAQGLGSVSVELAGLLFGIPNLLYLATAGVLTGRFGQRVSPAGLAWMFLLMAVALFGQAQTQSLTGLILWRTLMGLALTGGFIALHALVAALIHESNAGRTFGWLESGSKWGAVAAGLAAGAMVDGFGSHAPFLLGAGIMTAAAAWLAIANCCRPRTENI